MANRAYDTYTWSRDVTPDGADVVVDPPSRAVYVKNPGNAGVLRVRLTNNTGPVDFRGIMGGVPHRFIINLVYAEGTTVSQVTALR